MTIHLDHTIVPAKDKTASAEFFAEIFGLAVKRGHFAEVQVNEHFHQDPVGWIQPRRGSHGAVSARSLRIRGVESRKCRRHLWTAGNQSVPFPGIA
jgi:hypothetical protein